MDLEGAKLLLNRRHRNPGQAFWDAYRRDGRVIAPGCHCAMDAAVVRMVIEYCRELGESSEINAAYGSGWGHSAMNRYKPDKGFHSRDAIIEFAKNLVEGAYPLPVILDMETGFGPLITMEDIVRAYHLAGISVMHLEDQDPDLKGCGHHGGLMVVDLDVFLTKLRMALTCLVANESDMLLMARTDAYNAANGSPEEALRRGKAFADLRVGNRKVDLIWFELPTPDPVPAKWLADEMRKYDPEVKLGINFSPNMDQDAWFKAHPDIPPATYAQYAEMGYILQFHTVWSAKVAMQAMFDWTLKLARKGAHGLYEFQDQLRGHPTASGQTMSRTDLFQALNVFVGGEAAVERLKKSKGYGADEAYHDVGTGPSKPKVEPAHEVPASQIDPFETPKD